MYLSCKLPIANVVALIPRSLSLSLSLSLLYLSQLRMAFYIVMTALDDEETQKSGAVCIHHGTDWDFDVMDAKLLEFFSKVPGMMKCIPLRLQGFHFCYNNSKLRSIFSLMQLGVSKEIRHRMRVHYGSQVECHYKLMTFGIPVEQLPVTHDGELRLTGHNKWLARRQKIEAAVLQQDALSATFETVLSSPSSKALGGGQGLVFIVDLPSRYDVLLGRGKPYQEHSGNNILRELIASQFEEYDRAARGAKTAIAERVVVLVKESGGRFLQKNNDGLWVQASGKLARDKVSHGFRKKREMDNVAVAATSTSLALEGGKRAKVVLEKPTEQSQFLASPAFTPLSRQVTPSDDEESKLTPKKPTLQTLSLAETFHKHDDVNLFPFIEPTLSSNDINQFDGIFDDEGPIPNPISISEREHSELSSFWDAELISIQDVFGVPAAVAPPPVHAQVLHPEEKHDDLLVFLEQQKECFKCTPLKFYQWCQHQDITNLEELCQACSDSSFVQSEIQNNGLKVFKTGPFLSAVSAVSCRFTFIVQ
jgi:hypothetical protein